MYDAQRGQTQLPLEWILFEYFAYSNKLMLWRHGWANVEVLQEHRVIDILLYYTWSLNWGIQITFHSSLMGLIRQSLVCTRELIHHRGLRTPLTSARCDTSGVTPWNRTLDLHSSPVLKLMKAQTYCNITGTQCAHIQWTQRCRQCGSLLSLTEPSATSEVKRHQMALNNEVSAYLGNKKK